MISSIRLDGPPCSGALVYGAPEGVFQSSFSTQLAAPLFFPARPTYGSAERCICSS